VLITATIKALAWTVFANVTQAFKVQIALNGLALSAQLGLIKQQRRILHMEVLNAVIWAYVIGQQVNVSAETVLREKLVKG